MAEEYFKKELALHEGITGAATAGTLVLVHDQCYGHRYSRPKTSKAALSTIVERPERILATVLGISTAYVRLGDRHCDGVNPPHPHHNPPEHIPFKIRKTSRVVEITSSAVTNVHGTKWMEELKYMATDAERKLAATGKELVREPGAPSQPRKKEFHETDLYLCPESLNAFQGALGGVLDAVDAVFQGTSMGTGPSRAFVCIRPPGHHCSADHPSGFCWINNVHVGIEHAILQHGLTHAAIIDFDLHHGDGSQAITWARNKKVQGMHKNTPNWKKTSIGYFSLHDINSFPCEYGDDDKVQAASLCIDNAHGQSIWNIHLQPWKTAEEFWKLYEEKYLVLLEKTRQYLKHHTERLRKATNSPTPKAAIFISAGFDASEWETPGMQRHGANVPTEFYDRFTRDIVRLSEEDGTGVEGRVISVLEGGYSDRALTSGVLSHISGLTDGQVWSDRPAQGGLAFDMRQRLNGLSLHEDGYTDAPMDGEPALVSGNPAWWHESRLTELENLVNPPPIVIHKKVRAGPPAHFSSPTQSFTAKVVDPTKIHRSLSGRYSSASPSRAPTPPPPDVDWATAAHALSKLLIPEDRQTRSCKPEELAVTAVKKEKPAPPPPSTHIETSGRQLRGRKPVTSYADPGSDEEKAKARAASRANRRRTIADLPLATEEPPAARPTSRRMSIASSIGSVNGDITSSRASSVMPGRRSVTPAPSAASNGVQVKKARTSTAAASRIPKNPPPMPRVPSDYLKKTAPIREKEKEKENDVDQLTTGLKRITLKMPSKEEHDAREREREREKQKAGAAVKSTARKQGIPRAPKTNKTAGTSTTTSTSKKAGRATKSSKLPSSIPIPEAAAPAVTAPEPEPEPEPEPPIIAQAAHTTLAQPQPLAPADAPAILPSPPLPSPPPQSSAPSKRKPLPDPNPDRKPSTSLIDPRLIDPEMLSGSPSELQGTVQLTSEQLPTPEAMGAIVDEDEMARERDSVVSPPRPDTPPPPPPAAMLSSMGGMGGMGMGGEMGRFVNFTVSNFGTASAPAVGDAGRELHWTTPVSMSDRDARPVLASPAARSERRELPGFTSTGVIRFAGGNPHLEERADGEGEQGVDIWDVPETPGPAR